MKNIIRNSASSINTLKQCMRRYFYRYKAKLPGKKNADALVGNIIHKVIKKKIENREIEDERIFNQVWNDNVNEFRELEKSEEIIEGYRKDCWGMFQNWLRDLEPEAKIEAEVKLTSDRYRLIGYIDELIRKNGKTIVIENKSCKAEIITPEHELQAGIYILLFLENYKKLPDSFFIRFLRSGKKVQIRITDRLLSKARYECMAMRLRIISSHINDYPKSPSGLCKWANGECPFYEICKPFSY